MLALLSTHIETFSVSRSQDFYLWNCPEFLPFSTTLVWTKTSILLDIERPGVSGVVLHTHFPPNLQNILTPKPLELRTWNCEIMFTTFCVSRVTCHMSCVTCHKLDVTWHHNPQTVRARNLTFWGNVQHPLCVTYRKSHVTCHVPHAKKNLLILINWLS